MRSDFDLQAWYQNLFFQKKSVQNLFTLNCPEKNLHTTSEQTLFYDFCNTFLKNLCKHLTQKVFQKNPCPDLITKSFIEKQTCLSKKKSPAYNVSFIVLKKLIHSTSPPPAPLFLAIPVFLSFETVEEPFGSSTFLFAWFEHLSK